MDRVLPTLTSPEEFICIVKATVSQILLTSRRMFNDNFWRERGTDTYKIKCLLRLSDKNSF